MNESKNKDRYEDAKKFVRYSDGAKMYSMGMTKFQEVAPKGYVKVTLIPTDKATNETKENKVYLFAEGDKVDVIGTSKGKGTQGAIKRWNYGRGPEGHGSKSHRVAGARSAGTYPGRVLKGRKASGKTGNKKSTVQNLVVVKVDVEKNLILVKGAIPGPKGGLVTIREAVKR